jgi:multidrug efflux pump subunit AcrB
LQSFLDHWQSPAMSSARSETTEANAQIIIHEIVETLLIAIVLVILVVFIFLQNWRATLIPMIAVPVSLIGTFAVFRSWVSQSIRCHCCFRAGYRAGG